MFEDLPFTSYEINVTEMGDGNQGFDLDGRQKEADLEFRMTGSMATFSMPPISAFSETNLYHMESFSVFSCGSSFITKRKKYKSYLILYTYDGKGTLEYEGKTYQVGIGDGFMIDCMKPHVYATDGKCWKHSVLHFNGPLMETLFQSFLENGYVKFSQALSGPYHTRLIELLNLYTETSPAIEWQASACIDQMVTELLINSHIDRKPAFPQVIKGLMRMMEKDYSQSISMNDLAIRVGMSKFHLSREFKKYTGFSPYNYLIEVRIARAKVLLIGTGMTIGEVASKVGIPDVNNFINQFKKRTGVTPGRYRG